MNRIEEIKELTNELLQYCHEYYDLDAPTISDVEYDKKLDILKQLEDDNGFYLANSPTRKVQGETLPYLTKVKHSIPMLSADKSTNIEDVIKFKGDKMITASYKLDGATVVLKFNHGRFIQALSRGSGIEGEDITHTAKMIKNIPMTIPYKDYLEVRGEALIPWKYYNEMNVNGDMGHPRNVASGGLRQLSANEASKRNIYFYAFTLVNWKDAGVTTKFESLKFLYDNGFDVVPHVLLPEFGDGTVECAIKFLDREQYENPTDGWCFEINDLAYGESLGSTGHHDRKLYALKPEVEEHITHFRGIEYRTCRTGIVSLTALFDTVEIGNTNVNRCTLHNVDFFESLELGVGDEISVTKFNEIIPGIMENKTKSNTYELIDTCPSCGEKLIIKNTGTANVLYCPNEDCPSRNLARFTHFVSKNCADIEGLSERTLETLISHGFIHSFKDIYHLSDYKNELVQLDGFGEKSVSTLLSSIEKSRDIKLENFINALGIPNIGLSAAKTIAECCTGDIYGLFNLYFSNFKWTKLNDFGDIMAKNIEEYLYNHIADVEELADEMHFIIPEKVEVKENPFVGKSICVTGKLNSFNRDSINAKITELGAKVASGVTSKTDYLITNTPDSGSSKNVNAKKFGTKIITEEEFLRMAGE